MKPAGAEHVFAEDTEGGITTTIQRVPGTTFVLTVDTGTGDHSVHCVDAAAIGTGDPVKGFVQFPPGIFLNGGIAASRRG